jgi:hypothetical protein
MQTPRAQPKNGRRQSQFIVIGTVPRGSRLTGMSGDVSE